MTLSEDHYRIIIDNRNAQLQTLLDRLNAKETALQLIMDALSLEEAKRIARRGISQV